jgi:hypothetical protein
MAGTEHVAAMRAQGPLKTGLGRERDLAGLVSVISNLTTHAKVNYLHFRKGMMSVILEKRSGLP